MKKIKQLIRNIKWLMKHDIRFEIKSNSEIIIKESDLKNIIQTEAKRYAKHY